VARIVRCRRMCEPGAWGMGMASSRGFAVCESPFVRDCGIASPAMMLYYLGVMLRYPVYQGLWRVEVGAW